MGSNRDRRVHQLVPAARTTFRNENGARLATHDLPYTGTTAPRVTVLSGDARNRIVAATSSTLGHDAKSAFGIDWRLAAVSMTYGATAFTRMFSDASSAPSAAVIAATPAFAIV